MNETRAAPPPKPAAPQSSLWFRIVNTVVVIGVFFLLYLLFSQVVKNFGLDYYLIFVAGILLL